MLSGTKEVYSGFRWVVGARNWRAYHGERVQQASYLALVDDAELVGDDVGDSPGTGRRDLLRVEILGMAKRVVMSEWRWRRRTWLTGDCVGGFDGCLMVWSWSNATACR